MYHNECGVYHAKGELSRIDIDVSHKSQEILNIKVGAKI